MLKKFSIWCKYVYVFGFLCFLFCVCCFELFVFFVFYVFWYLMLYILLFSKVINLKYLDYYGEKELLCGKLKWLNGIIYILCFLLSYIYIFCVENDFNGNLVNIWYIYVFVYYIKYMYILVIVNVLSFVKK